MSKQVYVQPPMLAVNVTLPTFAAVPLVGCTMQQLIDISCPRGAQQQTRHTLLLLSIEGADGRMLNRFVDCAPHTVWAASIMRQSTAQ